MILKPRTNEYGHTVVDCPFCDGFAYVRNGNRDALLGLQRHIRVRASSEALAVACGEIGTTLHLEYYKEHTRPKVIIVENQRSFDGDLKINKL